MKLEEPLAEEQDDPRDDRQLDPLRAETEHGEDGQRGEDEAARGGTKSGEEASAAERSDGRGEPAKGARDPGQRSQWAREPNADREVCQYSSAGEEEHAGHAESPEVDDVGCPQRHAPGGVKLNRCFGTRTTTVDMALSPSVCRRASQSGKSHPM